MIYDSEKTYQLQKTTFSMLLIGALAGAFLGAGLLALVGLLADGPGGYPYLWDAFILAGFVGGVIGGLSLPFVASTALSHVAIGRILIEISIGTTIGTIVGSIISPFDAGMGLLGALVGFAASIALLQRPSLRRSSVVDPNAPPNTR